MRWGGAGLVVLAVSPACTLGSLASYEVQQCNPAADEQYAGAGGSAPDVCDRLNDGNTTDCAPWQCDPATSQCVRRTRDDDRDGDPPTACGGGDCDDADPNLNSLRVASPTTIASLSLDPAPVAPPTLSYDGVTPMLALTAGQCLTVSDAEPQGNPQIDACTAAAGGTVPTQPYAASLAEGGFAAAFVATDGCPMGALGFTYVPPSGSIDEVHATASCGGGAALPSLSILGGGKAAVAYYGSADSAFNDPLTACPTTVPTALMLFGLSDLTQPNFGETPTLLTRSAASIGPPALLWDSPVLFAASPDANAATIWALAGGSLARTASASIVSLVDARYVALGARAKSDGTTRLAIVAQLGCTSAAVHVALVDYDPSTSSFAAAGDVELAAGAAGTSFQTAPSVEWVAARNRWLATWVATGPQVVARFFDDTATPSEAPFTVARGASAAVALENGHAALLAQQGTEAALFDSEVRCP